MMISSLIGEDISILPGDTQNNTNKENENDNNSNSNSNSNRNLHRINFEQYCGIAGKHKTFIQSLGKQNKMKAVLIIYLYLSQSHLSTHSNSLLSLFIGLLQYNDNQQCCSNIHQHHHVSHKGAIPITFGHENWNLSYFMFFGIRLAVSTSNSFSFSSSISFILLMNDTYLFFNLFANDRLQK